MALGPGAQRTFQLSSCTPRIFLKVFYRTFIIVCYTISQMLIAFVEIKVDFLFSRAALYRKRLLIVSIKHALDQRQVRKARTTLYHGVTL